jgi:hypothetical protein
MIEGVNWLATHLVDLVKDIRERLTEKFEELEANEDEIIM